MASQRAQPSGENGGLGKRRLTIYDLCGMEEALERVLSDASADDTAWRALGSEAAAVDRLPPPVRDALHSALLAIDRCQKERALGLGWNMLDVITPLADFHTTTARLHAYIMLASLSVQARGIVARGLALEGWTNGSWIGLLRSLCRHAETDRKAKRIHPVVRSIYEFEKPDGLAFKTSSNDLRNIHQHRRDLRYSPDAYWANLLEPSYSGLGTYIHRLCELWRDLEISIGEPRAQQHDAATATAHDVSCASRLADGAPPLDLTPIFLAQRCPSCAGLVHWIEPEPVFKTQHGHFRYTAWPAATKCPVCATQKLPSALANDVGFSPINNSEWMAWLWGLECLSIGDDDRRRVRQYVFDLVASKATEEETVRRCAKASKDGPLASKAELTSVAASSLPRHVTADTARVKQTLCAIRIQQDVIQTFFGIKFVLVPPGEAAGCTLDHPVFLAETFLSNDEWRRLMPDRSARVGTGSTMLRGISVSDIEQLQFIYAGDGLVIPELRALKMARLLADHNSGGQGGSLRERPPTPLGLHDMIGPQAQLCCDNDRPADWLVVQFPPRGGSSTLPIRANAVLPQAIGIRLQLKIKALAP